MSETSFERRWLRRSHQQRTINETSWADIAFATGLGFIVLVLLTLATFGPIPQPKAAAADTKPAMTDQEIAHQSDQQVCDALHAGEPTVGGHRSQAEDYCNKYAK